MRSLVIGASLLALMAPAAYAQQSGPATSAAMSGQTERGHYMIFFDLDRATLTSSARQVIAQAAQDYQRTGAVQISLAGHADRSASEDYNLRLSERRAEAVRRELVRLGVPEGSIATTARGETDPLVQTADGVREPRNRRVEIVIPQPAAPRAAPPAEAAAPAEPERMAEGRGERFTFSLGPVYGHNFKETDDDSESDLVGAELVFNALPGFLGGVSLKQTVLWAFNAVDEGLAGRSVLSLDFAPDLGIVRPRLSANFGGVYGNGVQDGLVAGPELALDVNLPGGFTLRPKVAYDYQFRNPWNDWDDFDNGILWGVLDLGFRF
jgi:hypothetical protein